MTRLLGAILAGGRSCRFGSDKALARLGELTLIEHVIAALRPQCDAIVVCGRAFDGVDALDDRPGPGLGPLGGLAAALHAGRIRGFDAVLSVPCDTPRLPDDLPARLGAGPAVLQDMPVIGLWPCTMSEALDRHIASSRRRSMRAWADLVDAEQRPAAQIANLNTVADLLMITADVG